MKVFTKPGGQAISLTKNDFLAQGGQGSVYVKGGRAYKLYHDPSHMIPTGKITALSQIQNPRVIKPDHALVDGKGKLVGYDMRFIDNAWTLCQLFPQAFRTRNGLTADMVNELVGNLRSMVADVHKAQVLIVDLNEMNMLVSRDFTEVYGIDADSYQVAGYPATVIMPSVMDPKVRHNDFSEVSDWFSFGVVAFQMFVGIHPYKGNHSGFMGPNKLQDRMQAGVSVFNPDVRVPKVTLPFTTIPKAYLNWFEAVFERGERSAPPIDLHGVVHIVVPAFKLVGGGVSNLNIDLLRQYPTAILGHWHSFGSAIVCLTDTVYRNARQVLSGVQGQVVGVSFTPRANKPVVASLEGLSLHLYDVDSGKELPFDMAVEQAMHCDGRVYVKVGTNILEVTYTEVGAKIIPSGLPVSNCMERATTLYEGVVIQNMLGKVYVNLFPGAGLSVTKALPELDSYNQIVDARCVQNVLMVVGVKNGVYDRLVFRFNTARDQYDVRVVPDITPTGLNFTVLDTGVAACLTEEAKLELFTAARGTSMVKVVEDKALDGDMVLGKEDGKVVFWRSNQLHRISTK